MSQWRYAPTAGYGGQKVENQSRTISPVQVSPDGKKVLLAIAGLKTGQVACINHDQDVFSDPASRLIPFPE